MKNLIIAKILCIMAVCFIFTQCDNIPKHDTVEESNITEYQINLIEAGTVNVYKYEFEGHVFQLHRFDSNITGIVHDPNCPCYGRDSI